MIQIVVDSAADFLTEELAERNMKMAPLNVLVGEDSYKDEVELKREQLYKLLVSSDQPIKTSQPTPTDFVEIFEEAQEKGVDVICIMLSSALSGTYQSACLAKNIVDYDRIFVIDSLSAAVGVRVLVDKAEQMDAQEKTAEEIVETLEELKGRLRIRAAIDTLKYLYLGGRVSKTAAVVADTVNLKPGITVSQEGTVEVIGKYLGLARATKDLVKQMKAAKIDPEYPIYGVYSASEENVQKLSKSLSTAGFEMKSYHELGATLGVHVGPGAFGYVYVEAK